MSSHYSRLFSVDVIFETFLSMYHSGGMLSDHSSWVPLRKAVCRQALARMYQEIRNDIRLLLRDRAEKSVSRLAADKLALMLQGKPYKPVTTQKKSSWGAEDESSEDEEPASQDNFFGGGIEARQVRQKKARRREAKQNLNLRKVGVFGACGLTIEKVTNGQR